MADELPNEFDLVVIGTGLPESCVAAAASRVGKTVLHVDPNNHYGGVWSSFNLQAYIEHLQSEPCKEFRNAKYYWFVDEGQPTDAADSSEAESLNDSTGDTATPMETEKQVWTQAKVLAMSKRFNIDLCPKLLYAAGSLVNLLIQSNICRYAEFRAVDNVCTIFNGNILSVPCTRADVFNTKELTIVEKRMLMKFLKTCINLDESLLEDECVKRKDETFHEYLKEQRVTDKVANCVIQAIAMVDNNTSFAVGLSRTQDFMKSLGRYGSTPFLFPMYGCGELPQCFCRLCAVFGGIYCLKYAVTEIKVDTERPGVTLKVLDKVIRAGHIVGSQNHIPAELAPWSSSMVTQFNRPQCSIARATLIATSPMGNADLNSGGGGVNFLRLLYEGREAYLIQLSYYSSTCPKGFYLFHLTTLAVSDDPEADTKPFITQVFNDAPNAPQVVFSSYFTIVEKAKIQPNKTQLPVVICSLPPFFELDYDSTLTDASLIFHRIYNEEDFLPRAPDPEEIVVEGEDPCALNENHLESDLRAQIHELQQAVDKIEIVDEGEDPCALNENHLESDLCDQIHTLEQVLDKIEIQDTATKE